MRQVSTLLKLSEQPHFSSPPPPSPSSDALPPHPWAQDSKNHPEDEISSPIQRIMFMCSEQNLVQDYLVLLIRQLLCLDHFLWHQHYHFVQVSPWTLFLVGTFQQSILGTCAGSNLEVSIDHEVIIFGRAVAHRAGPSRLLLVHHQEQRCVETLYTGQTWVSKVYWLNWKV